MIKKDDYAVFGKLLIDIQFLETLIKLYISYFKPEIKKKNGITGLNSKSILDDTDGSRKTLGALMKILNSNIEEFKNEEFKELLEKRNIFAHNLHKEYLSVKANKENDLTNFISRLSHLVEKYTDIFTGLHSITIKSLSKGKVSTKGIEQSETELYNYLEKLKDSKYAR
jgi:hypothetical protein